MVGPRQDPQYRLWSKRCHCLLCDLRQHSESSEAHLPSYGKERESTEVLLFFEQILLSLEWRFLSAHIPDTGKVGPEFVQAMIIPGLVPWTISSSEHHAF